MARVRLSMRKIKEVLRLNATGLSNRKIANICNVGKSTVADYLRRATAAGLSWPLPDNLGEEQIERLLFPPPPDPSCPRPLPDWSVIHQELKKKGVTLALVWEEYKAIHPRRLSIQPILRLVSPLAWQAECMDAPRAQGRRKAIRRLLRPECGCDRSDYG